MISTPMMKLLPECLVVESGRHRTEYRLAPDLVGKPRDTLKAGDQIVADAEQLDCTIVRDARARHSTTRAADSTIPVYRSGDRGSLATPTGRLFVRLPEDARLADHARTLARLGLKIDVQNEWAPESGWVNAVSGDIADALTAISAVADELGADVEPELLRIGGKRFNTP